MAIRDERRKTYPLKQVIGMLGMTMNYGYELASSGKFPFPIIQVNVADKAVPKKPVDDFLERGIMPKKYSGKSDWIQGKRGPLEKWTPSNHVNWNLPIMIALNNRFNQVIRNMNKELVSPIDKGDAIRLAAEEFIQRRPQYVYEEEVGGVFDGRSKTKTKTQNHSQD